MNQGHRGAIQNARQLLSCVRCIRVSLDKYVQNPTFDRYLHSCGFTRSNGRVLLIPISRFNTEGKTKQAILQSSSNKRLILNGEQNLDSHAVSVITVVAVGLRYDRLDSCSSTCGQICASKPFTKQSSSPAQPAAHLPGLKILVQKACV